MKKRAVRILALSMMTCGSQSTWAQPMPASVNDSKRVGEFLSSSTPPVTIYSLQSLHGAANTSTEADVYLAPDREPLTYSIFINLGPTSGPLFPGAMIADNMGLGNSFAPGDEITSYALLLYRSVLDPQPGLADVHVELWDGDPFCAHDTPGGGFACAPIPGTAADFTDIPAGTQFWAKAVLPKGVVVPNDRVWMVVSGSQTGNPSPCRIGWDISYGPPEIGFANPEPPILTQRDLTGQGSCCTDGSPCDIDSGETCDGDDDGYRRFCSDGDAESPASRFTQADNTFNCQFFPLDYCGYLTAFIRSAATSTISLVPTDADVPHTITGSEISLGGGHAQVELEIRLSNWDPEGNGTLLKAWEADIDPAGYTSGFQGFLSPTTVPCTLDEDCKTAFGGVCSLTGDPCISRDDCPLFPFESCTGSRCAFPLEGPTEYTQCEPGFIFTGRRDYVYLTAGGDLPAVDISEIGYRYASAVQHSPGISVSAFDPFPAGGVYAGTLRLDTSDDCKGTFTVGFVPHPGSRLVDQDNEFIPLVGYVPAKVTCEIGRCCYDLEGSLRCAENVTRTQCDDLTGPSLWEPDPNLTCEHPCVDCLDDSDCQDGAWCNGPEICDESYQCAPGSSPCNDGIVCTIDECNEALQECHVTPDDLVCDDDVFCNGQERCDVDNGCQRRPSPCLPDLCDEDLDICAPPGIPTVSAWGLLMLGLLLFVSHRLVFRGTYGSTCIS